MLRLMMVMMIVASALPGRPQPESPIDSLSEPNASLGTVHQLLDAVPQDELIEDVLVALDTDPTFQRGSRARRLAYELLAGTKNEQGLYSFSHPDQVQRLLTAISSENRSIRLLVLQRIHMVTPEFREVTVQALSAALQTSDFGGVMLAVQALARLGEHAMAAGERLRAIVVDPAQALPALRDQLDGLDMKRVQSLRAEAALARLYAGAYPEDIGLYAALDEQGQIAGGLAILAVFNNREAALQTPGDGHLRALEYLRKVFTDRNRAAALHPSNVFAFAYLFVTEDYEVEVRQAARATLAEIAAASPDPEFQKLAQTYLDKFK